MLLDLCMVYRNWSSHATYFLFYFRLLLISNFRGSKNRGSMDPVHDKGVHGPGP